MEKQKYVVTVYGDLKFTNGKKVGQGGFVPSNIDDEEIKEKLQRKLIAPFDNKVSATVYAANADNINIVAKLQKENEELKEELKQLSALEKSEAEEIAELKKEIENLKKAGKK